MDDVQALNPPGLTDAQSAWLNRVLHVDLSAGPRPSAPPQTSPPSGDAMRPDCEIVRNKVPGPKHHVLCATHRHILDETTKTIIAADLAEYKQKFPPPKHAAPSGPKKGGSRPQAAQSAVPEPVGAMPDLKPIPVPKLVGGDKAAFVQEMSALDTLKPSKDHPDLYIAMLNGKETPVAKAGADAIRDKARKSLTSAIGFVSGTCDNAADSYKSQKAINDDQWMVSKLAAAVQSVKSLGKYQDPGADVTKLVASAQAGLNEARGALGGNKFGLAAALIADAEGKATQANQMVMAWINGAISGADTSVTVLKHTKTASFAVVSGLAAVGTGGAAGVIAAAVLPTLAVAGG